VVENDIGGDGLLEFGRTRCWRPNSRCSSSADLTLDEGLASGLTLQL